MRYYRHLNKFTKKQAVLGFPGFMPVFFYELKEGFNIAKKKDITIKRSDAYLNM